MKKLFISVAILLITSINIYARAEATGGCDSSLRGPVRTLHSTVIGGRTIEYTATVGFMEVLSSDKAVKGCIFYTAYTVVSEKPRPITFAFNGGPGSASVWLHLGFLGPKRVDMGADGMVPAPIASTLIPNESSPLDVTDIVMIDPVATGFSHGNGSNDKFFGAKNDYMSVAAFIRNYLNANNRWLSPKFIVGESYGGIRGALLARYLQTSMFISIDGVFFVSPAFSWTPLVFDVPDSLAAYWSFLPTFATTARYHGKVAPKYMNLEVPAVYELAKTYSDSVYRDALLRGNTLGNVNFEQVAHDLADLTGLNVNLIRSNNLRITDGLFFRELLSDKSEIVGRFDGRFANVFSGSSSESSEYDPSSVALQYGYTAGINEYLRNELKFEYNGPYNIFGDVTTWAFDSDGLNFNVLGDLSRALAENPKLKIVVASGYFDLACPMNSVDYDVSQLPRKEAFLSRIQVTRYFGGHMMYIHSESLKRLKSDFASFVQAQSTTVASPRAPRLN